MKKNQSTTDASDLPQMANDSIYDKKYEKCKYDMCDGYGAVWGYEEDGLMRAGLCKCELDRIEDKRIGFAQIPEEFIKQTVGSFQIDCYKKAESKTLATIAKKIATNYVKDFEETKENGQGLYFYSDTKGSGKSRLAVSVGNELIKGETKNVRYITTLDLFLEIRSTFNNETGRTESKIIADIRDVDLLILDDVGIGEKATSDWENRILYQVLDHRMTKKKTTIFTSNVPVRQLKYDQRTVSRIENMAMQIRMPEESVRSEIAKNKNVEMMKRLMRD